MTYATPLIHWYAFDSMEICFYKRAGQLNPRVYAYPFYINRRAIFISFRRDLS